MPLQGSMTSLTFSRSRVHHLQRAAKRAGPSLSPPTAAGNPGAGPSTGCDLNDLRAFGARRLPEHLGRHVYAGHGIALATPFRPGPMQGRTEPSIGQLRRLSSVRSGAKHLMGILSCHRAKALSVRACSRRLLPTP